ncbi:Holliday junction branch migration protein RuvA [Demequina sp. NBRC 110056]|uniref:Holliday junction branch migration protein RuvA n=1 Tax=Demequina sp. NBRC 110056 TaxID=1570345 RepID=UPI0009FFDC02|nr:Holliday junction branch migration protein RuvA [Demequina sp. NBRC 110056]
MIAQLSGTVLSVRGTSTVVEVGGVGMLVQSTPATLAELRVRQEVRLHTTLVVREESLTLFGFLAESERDAFEALQSVQGVGPRLALAMLSVHAPEALSRAVADGDRKALENVPGIGAKVAARLLLELGGKLSLPDAAAPAGTTDARGQVEEALVALGWNAKAAASAVEAVATAPIAESEVPATLKAALQAMGASRG